MSVEGTRNRPSPTSTPGVTSQPAAPEPDAPAAAGTKGPATAPVDQSSFTTADRKPEGSGPPSSLVRPSSKRGAMSLGKRDVRAADQDKTSAPGQAAARLSPDLRNALEQVKTDVYKQEEATQKLAEAVRAGNPDVLQALGDVLFTKEATSPTSYGMAKRVIDALRQIGTPEAAAQLARASGHPDYSNVAADATSALGRMGPQGLEAALGVWGKAGAEQRRNLLSVLTSPESLREPRAQAAVLDAVRSKDANLSMSAADKLTDRYGKLDEVYAKNPGLRRQTLDALSDVASGHHDSKAREKAASAAGDLIKAMPSAPENAEALSRLTHARDGSVSSAAIEIYADQKVMAAVNADPKLQKQALGDLKAAAGTGLFGAERAYRAMGMIQSKEAREHLVGLANSSSASTRAGAMEGLKQSGDPSVTELILGKALKDPSPEVRSAAFGALRDLQWAGSDADKIANFTKLSQAAKSAKGEAKQELDYAAKLLKQSVTLTSFGYDGMVAGLDKGDLKAVAESMANAGGDELKLFEATLKTKGKALDGLLGEIRAADPSAHAKILDSLTAQMGGKFIYANVSDASTKPYKDLLVSQLKTIPEPEMRAYAERQLKQPPGGRNESSKAAVEVLGAMGDDRSLKALIDFGPSVPAQNRAPLLEAIKSRPQDQVDRIAMPVMREPGVSDRKDLAAMGLSRAGSAEGKQLATDYFVQSLEAKGAALKAHLEAIKEPQAQDIKRLNDLYKLRGAVYHHPDALPAANRQRLENDIRSLEAGLQRRIDQHEQLAAKVTDMLSDPDVKESLGRLPEERRAELIEKSFDGVSGTAAARRYVQEQLVPALNDPTKDPLYKTAGKGANSTRLAALAGINKFAPELALQGEQTYQKAVQSALGLKNAAEMERVEKALVDLAGAEGNAAKAAKAKETLEGMGFSGGYNKLNATFATMNFALGVRDLVNDPSWRNAVSTAKDSTEMVERMTLLVEESPRLQAAGKLVGKAAYPLTAVLGFMDLRESAENRDLGGTLFDSLTTTGGIVATAGLVLDGTVAGAVAGVPLTVIGGAMSVVGAVGKWVFGDSKTERLAKQLGYL
jgi:HEAT repeat protein